MSTMPPNKLRTIAPAFATFCFALLSDGLIAQQLPRENIVDVPSKQEQGLCVSNLFQTNMVLQREKPLKIWGWADPSEEVTVTFAEAQASTKAGPDRRWELTLPPMPATPDAQQMTIAGKTQTLTLENILIGDVWVLGGQSNMEFPLDRIENGQLEIVSANYPKIRILTVPAMNGPERRDSFERLHEWSDWFGRHYRKGDWDECSPEIARELSAIGFVFARRIHMASMVPIGVIDASRGGTTVEAWTPDEDLRQIVTPQVSNLLREWDEKVAEWDATADLQQRIANFKSRVERFANEGRPIPANEKEPTDLRPGPAMDQNRPGNCFASMIGPLVGFPVKGVIFHQGYNNCFNGTEGAMLYRQVFPEMIKAWREAFDDPQLPFGILSLCTEGPVQTLDNYCEMMANTGPFIREAQYQTFLELYRGGDKHIGFTSTYDLRRRWYHPQLKIPAGERIARWALATQYGFDGAIRWKPPLVESSEAAGDKLVIHLDEPASAVDDGGPILGFAVAGKDRKFHPAQAVHQVTGQDDRGREKTDKRILELSSPMVPAPVHFRYAWARSPLGNLQAERMTDIPFATQRSDNWSLENVPTGVHAEPVQGKWTRPQQRAILDALREQDIQRIIAEAETLQR